MPWFLQTPDGASPKLLGSILSECGAAVKGGAAFAFASAQGVKLLAAEPTFSKFLKASEFVVVVGLDAITDTRAVDELRKVSKSHPNFKPKLFLHKVGGSLFHPKTMWLSSMAKVILSPALSLFDFRRKFGTWVKPCEVAASAPLRMMLRSLRMSPMCRSCRNSIPVHYSPPRRTPRSYPLRLPVIGMTGGVALRICRATE